MKDTQQILPPGFRFHPTDEELILHYLNKKVKSIPLPVSIIAEVDVYKFNPWDLPAKAVFGEKEWYFFSHRERKYPNGARPNRSAGTGYWKATGTDKAIAASSTTANNNNNNNIGVKKVLVFYKGRPPTGVKTNWIMHEYRLLEPSNYNHNHKNNPRLGDSSMRLDNWVLCRIYKKANTSTSTTPPPLIVQDEEIEYPQNMKSLHSQTDLKGKRCSSLSNLLDPKDYSLLSHFLSQGQPDPSYKDPNPVLNFGNQGQQLFNNSTYFEEKVIPQLNYSSVSMLESSSKRQRLDIEVDHMLQTSKRLMIHNTHNLIGQPFLNQQLLLSSNFQFQD